LNNWQPYIAAAQNQAAIIDAQYPPGSAQNMAAKVLWYYNQVHTGAPDDIKDLKQYKYDSRSEAFGNFLAGAVGTALGLPSWMLLKGAGTYQILSKTSKWDWGNSNFDDPLDQVWINTGIQWYLNQKKGGGGGGVTTGSIDPPVTIPTIIIVKKTDPNDEGYRLA
jgi:hypothetical protein